MNNHNKVALKKKQVEMKDNFKNQKEISHKLNM